MNAVANYFGNIWKGLSTAAIGMRVTVRYLFRTPVTVQYPNEVMPRTDRYRGIHYLEQDKCINCKQCAKACPVDCIEIVGKRDKATKVIDWVRFSIDYQKCMFCELCVYPCPENCIHMGQEFAFVTRDRAELVLDLLSWKGMHVEDTQSEEVPAGGEPKTKGEEKKQQEPGGS